MAVYDAHGVVVVRVSTGTIHRIDSGSEEGGHGIGTLTGDNWELFPNLTTATEAGHTPCQLCFYERSRT